MTGIEPVTSSLPRKRSTPELHRHQNLMRNVYLYKMRTNKIRGYPLIHFERAKRLEPSTLSLEG
jgi:hypothetical protein